MVQAARAEAGCHRRCQSDARGRLTPCVPLPIPQRQLKKKSTTSPCLEMVGYVVTARNPVPRISLYLLYPKRGLRFGWIVRPRRNPFAPLEPPAFIRIFWFSAPARVCFHKSYLPVTPLTRRAPGLVSLVLSLFRPIPRSKQQLATLARND